jgi:isocitrate dehydrogenase (NAD+)
MAAVAAGLIPGDGIGPEITKAMTEILRAAGAQIDWIVLPGGAEAFRDHGVAMPAETVETVRELGLALKGPIEVPMHSYGNPNAGLRHAIRAYANVRTVQGYRVTGRRWYERLNVAVIRDLTEDVGRGASQRTVDDGAGMAFKAVTRSASEKVSRFAYTWTEQQGLSHVTVAHLGPSQPDTGGLFLETALKLAAEFPRLTVTEEAVDPLCMHLIQDPAQYEVILTMNVYGGILCGVVSGLAGSVGVMPGANFGDGGVVLEAGHGSAPKYVGKNTANPMGCLLSGTMLLDHVGQTEAADKVRAALAATLSEGIEVLPPDLGGKASLSAFVTRIGANL